MKSLKSNQVFTQNRINQLGMITLNARNSLYQGDMKELGRLLDMAQEELVAIGVSDDQINRMVEVARNFGALGAKLTGGGLGGCILALAPNYAKARVIANQLMKAGAIHSWYFTLESKG
jgi:mevalonate kinase